MKEDEEMTQRTPLYEMHTQAGGRMVDFAGWEMPLHYGSQIAEHKVVREKAGMFDVSHMTVIDISGAGAAGFLGRVVANDVARLDEPGKALYGVLLNPSAGVIDDLIVYRWDDGCRCGFRCIVNASTREKVLAWFDSQAAADVVIQERDLAMIAVQGPDALSAVAAATGVSDVASIDGFTARDVDSMMIARTGYTGEDGVEIVLPAALASPLWAALLEAGVAPAGLGARDTLRLEAGLNLYGQDMDESTSPLVSNLGWTIAWEPPERHFIGRDVLETQRSAGVIQKLTGLVLEDKGVMRHGQTVVTEAGAGVVTSGIFSPTLGYSIALARLPRSAKGRCEVEMRGKLKRARIVRPPFVRRGARVHK
jgi:aminomethyltransferase